MALTKAHNRMVAGAPVNVLDFGAVGDGVTDDTAAIQAAIDDMIANRRGILFFPKGIYKITSTIAYDTSNTGLELTLQGDGIGSTFISVAADVHGFAPSGYLNTIKDMQISCTVGSSTKYGIKCYGVGNSGRRKLENLEITGFYHAVYHNGGFDQLEVANCNLSANISSGFYIDVDDASSSALLNITSCIMNDNGDHGCHFTQSAGQLINTTLTNCEMVSNLKHGVLIESTWGTPVTSVILDNCDIETVPAGYSAIRFHNVYKFSIRHCSFNNIDAAVEGVITLTSAKDGIIESPWFADGISTSKKININSSTQSVYLLGLRQSVATPIDFYSTSAIDESNINLDNLKNQLYKKYIPISSEYNYAGLSETNLKGMKAILAPPSVNSSLGFAHYTNTTDRPLTGVRVLWYNTSTGSGTVRLALHNSSLTGNPTTYFFANFAAGSQNQIQNSFLTASTIPLDSTGITAFRILRNGLDPQDTLAADIGIIGVIFYYSGYSTY